MSSRRRHPLTRSILDDPQSSTLTILNAASCSRLQALPHIHNPIKRALPSRYYIAVERALGLRAEAHQINWAVVEGTQREPILVAHDRAAAPVDVDEAAALCWYNSRVRQIVETYNPVGAAVRFAEAIARGGNKEGAKRRSRIEGVLLQAIDSCGLKVSTGALASISAKLGTRNAKKYIEAGELRGLNLSGIPTAAREAVLVAVASLPRGAQ